MTGSITRREFLKTSVLGAGLTIAAVMTPTGLRLLSAEEAKKESCGRSIPWHGSP